MIPHIIHLCWFGKGKYPQLAQMCIDSWKRNLPDYEIMLWNEDNFNVNSTEFTKVAYQQKRWAFISDYVRLKALEEYGGIYMDTDLEVLKDFSELLENNNYVSSTLEGGLITAGFIAAEPHHPYICALKAKYENDFFVGEDGEIRFVMNPLLFTQVASEMYGYQIDSNGNDGKDGFTILPLEYFMPYRKTLLTRHLYAHRNYLLTDNTFAIHHDMGSWKKESSLSWWKRAIARQIIPRTVYLKLKEKKFKNLLNNPEGM